MPLHTPIFKLCALRSSTVKACGRLAHGYQLRGRVALTPLQHACITSCDSGSERQRPTDKGIEINARATERDSPTATSNEGGLPSLHCKTHALKHFISS